jgi:cyclopropane fatty-acyl-phospholipid synthase-like methyltransferase
VTDAVPKRIRWAVDELAIDPDDRLLEIGGGAGVAASLVCERLSGGGNLLVLDRSAKAIQRSQRRNAKHIASGRLALETVDLANFDARGARFDKVFAVNVNVFWTTPATAELSRIHSLLDPGGRFFVFYETPSAMRALQAVSRVREALRANGFAEQQLVSPSATLVACVAWRA